MFLDLGLGYPKGAVGRKNLLLRSLAPGSKLIDKHIIYQNICYLDHDRNVVICENCPDATYQDGHLIPICLLGRVAPQKDPA